MTRVKVKGKPAKDPTRSLHVALPPGLKARIAAAAEREGKTPSAWLVTAAMAALAARPGRASAPPTMEPEACESCGLRGGVHLRRCPHHAAA